jgi:hypothetical protein
MLQESGYLLLGWDAEGDESLPAPGVGVYYVIVVAKERLRAWSVRLAI